MTHRIPRMKRRFNFTCFKTFPRTFNILFTLILRIWFFIVIFLFKWINMNFQFILLFFILLNLISVILFSYIWFTLEKVSRRIFLEIKSWIFVFQWRHFRRQILWSWIISLFIEFLFHVTCLQVRFCCFWTFAWTQVI